MFKFKFKFKYDFKFPPYLLAFYLTMVSLPDHMGDISTNIFYNKNKFIKYYKFFLKKKKKNKKKKKKKKKKSTYLSIQRIQSPLPLLILLSTRASNASSRFSLASSGKSSLMQMSAASLYASPM